MAAKTPGDSVAMDRAQGWGEIHRRLEAEDDERRAWLDRYVRRMGCKVCAKKITDWEHATFKNLCRACGEKKGRKK